MMLTIPGVSSAIRKSGTPNENAARCSLTGDSAASARSSSNYYSSLFSSWCCHFERYHNLLECLEIVHLTK